MQKPNDIISKWPKPARLLRDEGQVSFALDASIASYNGLVARIDSMHLRIQGRCSLLVSANPPLPDSYVRALPAEEETGSLGVTVSGGYGSIWSARSTVCSYEEHFRPRTLWRYLYQMI